MFFCRNFPYFGGNFFFNFSDLSLHDEPDGESDVGSVLSGLTVEGSHHDVTGGETGESDDNDEVHYGWRGDGEGREMEERAVAAEVRRGQLGVTRDRAVRVQQPGNTILSDISRHLAVCWGGGGVTVCHNHSEL